MNTQGGKFPRWSMGQRLACARQLRAALFHIAIGGACAMSGPVLGAEVAPTLLMPHAAKTRAASVAQEHWVAREREVDVNLQALDPRGSQVPSALTVELFGGTVVTLDRVRVEERGSGDFTWYGKVRGSPESDAVLTVVNGRISGSIGLVDSASRKFASYRIETRIDGTAALRETDAARFPPDHPPGAEQGRRPPTTAKALSSAADAMSGTTTGTAGTAGSTLADTGAVVDVMVVYSNQTAAAASSAIGAQIQQAVDSANTAYANSGVAPRLRLVHYEQVNYAESGDFNTDLGRLTTNGDGYMDNVASLRNTYGADLVVLLVESSQYCGLSWMGPDPNYAFSVVNRSCASGNYSFAHEIGHLFGALHDPYVDPGSYPYAYGHGLAQPAAGWRTVMAYNNACAAAGTTCTRIPYFSNAAMAYGAYPLGSTTVSNNARVHNDNAYTVANFRTGAIAGCSYGLSPTSVSAGSAAVDGSVAVTSSSGCAWNTASSASWLGIGSGSATMASGTLYFAVGANSGPARSATITVGNQALMVTQASGCTYALNPTSASVGAGSSTGSVTLGTGAGCTWSASTGASWLTLSSSAGTGGGTLSYTVAANTGPMRTANITVNGATFVVTQAAPASTAVASLSVTSINFGSQVVGTTSAPRTAIVTNTGTATLTIAGLATTGNTADFVPSGTCAANVSLGAGQTCTLAYAFAPKANGGRSATVSVTGNATTVSLTLQGKGARK